MGLEIAFLALAIPTALGLLLPSGNKRRVLLVLVIALFTGRYVSWRIGNFPFGSFFTSPEGWWMAAVLVVEMLAILEYIQFLVTITWLTDRRAEADTAEQRLRERYKREGAEAIPSVDVLIPTYNEGPEVVTKTILAALQLDYPRFKVYVLDDGQRPWLRQFCERVGAHHIIRSDRKGAKAGNINHALNIIDGDLNLLLDADFIPYQNCLWRLAGFFDDPAIATVQTPQNFYNPDAIQHNLNISGSWGCEQAFFFQIIMPGRDAVGAAFCCGSCCMHRNAALRAVGGFPTTSITEDILLTVSFVKRGWKTIYLREATTMGLAAETMESFFVQRKRWGRGNIQVGYIIAQEKGLSLINKILFFPFYWMIQHGSRIFFQLIPLIFFMTGVGPLPATEGQEILDFQLPFILAVSSCMFILMRPFYLPIFTEAMSLFSAFALLPELLQSLVKPYSKGFSVTPKGTANSDLAQALFKQTFLPSCALLGLNIVVLLQIILDLSSAANSVGWQLALYGVIWCAINISLLVMCVLMSQERPQPRQEHRINVQRPARMITKTGSIIEGLLDDLSMSGARFTADPGPSREREDCTSLELATGLQVPVEALWSNHRNDWVMRFAELNLEQQKGLIGYAFSGEFESAEQPQMVQLRRTFQQLWRDVVG
jgi:cellulose synthase (UDP-forming)